MVEKSEQETKDILTSGKLILCLLQISCTFKLVNSKETYNLRNNEMTYFCIDDQNPPHKGVLIVDHLSDYTWVLILTFL